AAEGFPGRPLDPTPDPAGQRGGDVFVVFAGPQRAERAFGGLQPPQLGQKLAVPPGPRSGLAGGGGGGAPAWGGARARRPATGARRRKSFTSRKTTSSTSWVKSSASASATPERAIQARSRGR